MNRSIFLISYCLLALFFMIGCSDEKQNKGATDEVVVYTSLDQCLSEPILKEFERRTGIRVKPVYDTEAAKTTGLINRLIARKNSPDCDVLWNNEIIQTARLGEMGLLQEYRSPLAERIPIQYRDPNGRWVGFAARMRVIIYNTDKISGDNVPVKIADFASPQWRGQAAIARPFFGTTLTHMIVLNQLWGPDRLKNCLLQMRENDVALCPGNGSVRDMVASGERTFGLTDTDDAYGAILDGKPVAVKLPDPQLGMILIPNTVSIIRNAPNPAAAKKLVDFLLSADVERMLAKGRGAQIPLGTDLGDMKTPWDDLMVSGKRAEYDLETAAKSVKSVVELLRQAKMDQ